MNNLYLIIPFFIFLFINFIVAFYFNKKVSSNNNFISEFFISNRNLNGFIIAMSTAATFASSSTFIGGIGAAYKYGLAWVLVAMIQVPGIWFVFGTVGKRIAYLAHKYNAVTINEILLQKYKSKLLVTLTSIALIISFIAIITVQIIGGARLIEGAININYKWALIIFIISILSYMIFSGFRSIAYTDVFQGFFMIIGSIILLVATIYKAGGLETAISTINTINPDLLSISNQNKITPNFLVYLWILLCFALVGLPQIALRTMLYKDTKNMIKAMIISTIIITIIMFSVHFTGFLSNALIHENIIPDLVMPTLAKLVLPTSLIFIVLVIPFFAILSTVDSLLIQVNATIVKDLYLNTINSLTKNKNSMSTNKLKFISKTISLLILLIVFLLSFYPPDMIIWLNLMTFGLLQSSFLFPLLFALFYKKANKCGAIASIITGFTSYLILNLLQIKIFYEVHPLIISLTISLIALLIFNYVYNKYKKY